VTALAPDDPFAWVRPRYGEAALADVLPSVLAVLGVPGSPDPLGLAAQLDGVRRIAVLLVDGLGTYQVRAAAPYAPALAALAAGPGRQLTAGFPSTTPVSLVSLGTGAPPGRSGVLGFSVRAPDGGVLDHLAWRGDPDPAVWAPLPTCLEVAAAAGVAVTVVSRTQYVGSGLSIAANRGGTFRESVDVDTLADGMLAALRAGPGPVLVSGYHPEVDRAGHDHGLTSDEWHAAAIDVDRLVDRLVTGLAPDAALLLTADHGQLDVPATGRFDIAADPRLSAGVKLVAGDPRARYLYVTAGAEADVAAAWRDVLGPAAHVMTRTEAVAAGWFGPVPRAHLDRIGDVVVMCTGRHVVLSRDTERASVAAMIAFHGSATAAEMLIPLMIARPAG
jgi:hypothetical protein